MHRLAIVSRGWYPLVLGGADKFIASLADRLHKRGYEIIGITMGFGRIQELKTNYKMIIIRQRKRIPLISSIFFSYRSANLVNKINPDAVIVNGYWAEASPIFISGKIPIILIIHDVGLFRSQWAKKHRIKHMLRTFILRKNIRIATKIVVPTDIVKKDLVSYLGAEEDKIIVLGTEGVEGPFEYKRVNNNYFDIVQVARFALNKGQLLALKAFDEISRKIPNARLWLVGGAPSSKEQLQYFQKILDYAKRINKKLGWDAVRIILNADDIGKYYEIADICIAPSLGEEGYGLAVVECMSYGKPVIASDIFEKTGVVDRNRALIFRRGNYKELAEYIVRVYKDENLYEKLSYNALKYAKSVSWDRVADVFEEIIKEISGKER